MVSRLRELPTKIRVEACFGLAGVGVAVAALTAGSVGVAVWCGVAVLLVIGPDALRLAVRRGRWKSTQDPLEENRVFVLGVGAVALAILVSAILILLDIVHVKRGGEAATFGVLAAIAGFYVVFRYYRMFPPPGKNGDERC